MMISFAHDFLSFNFISFHFNSIQFKNNPFAFTFKTNYQNQF